MKIEDHPCFPTGFVVGHRALLEEPEENENSDDEDKAEEVGALIVKGTFHDLGSPEAVPKDEQVPILMSDVPFLAPNGDFEDASLEAWATTGSANLERVLHEERHWGRLTSDNNDANASMRQTLESFSSLGSREYMFGFEAWIENLGENEKMEVDGFRLETTDGPTEEICQFTAELTNSPKMFYSNSQSWPGSVTQEEYDVVLPATGNQDHPVYFDDVQVHENGLQVQYENDLAVYKPHADIVVLGPWEPGDGSGVAEWRVVMQPAFDDSNAAATVRAFNPADVPERPVKMLFGWAPTGQEPRLEQAGDEEELEDFDPSKRPLPLTFNNEFFNGFDRALTGNVPLEYFEDSAEFVFSLEKHPTNINDDVEVEALFTLKLPESRPIAFRTEVVDEGLIEDINVPLNLDTVIVEPEHDRFSVIWRGVFSFHSTTQLGVTVTGGPG